MGPSRLLAFVVLVSLVPSGWSECISYSDALKHIGATKCVTGKVLRVEQGNGGVHFFDFCEDYRLCPFTVVVFPGDLKRIGDIRRLQGRQIEIDGEGRGYERPGRDHPPAGQPTTRGSRPNPASSQGI
jgi:hypothetical protein